MTDSLLKQDMKQLKALKGKAKQWADDRKKTYDGGQKRTQKRRDIMGDDSTRQNMRAAKARGKAVISPSDTIDKANTRQVQQRMKEYKSKEFGGMDAGVSPKKKATTMKAGGKTVCRGMGKATRGGNYGL